MSQPPSVLVCNCGSSSIKFAIIRPETGEEVLSGIAERLASPEAAISWTLYDQSFQQPIAMADHRQALTYLLTILEANPDLTSTAIGLFMEVKTSLPQP